MIALVCRHPETKRMVTSALTALKAGPLEIVLADQVHRLAELGECCTLAIVGTEVGEGIVQQIPRHLRGSRCVRTTPTLLLFDPRSTLKLGAVGSLGYDDFAEMPLSAQELGARLSLLLGRGARRRQTLAQTGVDLTTGLIDHKRLLAGLQATLELGRATGGTILAMTVRFDSAAEIETRQGSGVWGTHVCQAFNEIRAACLPGDLVAWGGADRVTIIRPGVRANECTAWVDALVSRFKPKAGEPATARPAEGTEPNAIAGPARDYTFGVVVIDLARALQPIDAKGLLHRLDAAVLQADSTQKPCVILQDDAPAPKLAA